MHVIFVVGVVVIISMMDLLRELCIPYFMLFGGENAPNHGFWRENLRLGQI